MKKIAKSKIIFIISLVCNYIQQIQIFCLLFYPLFYMLKWSCKKLFTGIAIVSLIGTLSSFSLNHTIPSVSAQELASNYYERIQSEREKTLILARDFAYQYLQNSQEEPLWKNKFPYISYEKFFYTAKVYSPATHPVIGYVTISIDGR